jgi:hypothetical protein
MSKSIKGEKEKKVSASNHPRKKRPEQTYT